MADAVAVILIVDDVDGVRELCRWVLGARGHTVVEASNGLEALTVYQEQQPDAVLLDLTMPGMDGLQTLAALREVDPNARVAMLTGQRDEKTVRRALQLGARDYVVKPIRGNRLEEAIERLLAPPATHTAI
jgi:two-component system chemotaxis response regulator CheY